ncbi:MAG: DUF2007 domain-containing protein [Chitinophagaceae bacterium]|jgi:hypothetical protein|nr:DUF2007 domain-containing protein [Chitinophagaceae bacterium]OQY92352.1 MAG: hypothetical protein B6D37_13735 [Sphingobacteriales bacterium UTBCD1]
MEFVFVQSFNDYIEANIILGRLQNEGISCWLKNENSAMLTPIPISGIRLMVAKTQVERALELIDLFNRKPGAIDPP